MREKRAWLSIDTALWVLFLTGLAYSVALQYERGYVGYFGVPFSLVEVTVNSSTSSAATLVSILLLVYVVHLFTVYFVESSLKVVVPLFVSISIAATVLIATLTVLLNIKSGFRMVGLGAFCALLVMFEPVVARKTGATYRERLAASDAKFRSNARKNPLSRLPLRWEVALPLALLFAGANLVSLEVGRTEAQTQKSFLVTGTATPCFLVRAYGETVICAQYSGPRLLSKVQLLSKSDGMREWTLKQIGPFEPSP
jgi:hypothetical protein